MAEDVPILLFMAVIIVFVTLGCVLLAFFWLRRLSVSLRALFATVFGAAVLLLPLALVSDEADTILVLVGGLMIISVVGFPVAFLATRKLDRRTRELKSDIASVFE